MRILVDLPDGDILWLDAVARADGKSRAAVVRDAITAFRHRDDKAGMEQYFGLWARHGSTVDGLSYERALRDEWPSLDDLDQRPKSDAA